MPEEDDLDDGFYSIYLEDSDCPKVYIQFRDFPSAEHAMRFVEWIEAVVSTFDQRDLSPHNYTVH
jgi:hypothetical protein|tara:strand:- start:15189 stop:15383 length:195 start_codon:yes stop_codon:yes gene_type:complete